MKAWLVVWDSPGHARGDEIVTVLNGKLSHRSVREILEQIFADSQLTLKEKLGFLKNRKNADFHAWIDHGDNVFCGDIPLLWARLVDNIRVVIDLDSGHEKWDWDEIDRTHLWEKLHETRKQVRSCP